jgi:hypothetical protein
MPRLELGLERLPLALELEWLPELELPLLESESGQQE